MLYANFACSPPKQLNRKTIICTLHILYEVTFNTYCKFTFMTEVKYCIDSNYLFCHGAEYEAFTFLKLWLIIKSIFFTQPWFVINAILADSFSCSMTFGLFSTITFSRCWTCLWLSLWTTLNIWHVTPPSWALTTWMSLSECGRSMTQPHGMFQPTHFPTSPARWRPTLVINIVTEFGNSLEKESH